MSRPSPYHIADCLSEQAVSCETADSRTLHEGQMLTGSCLNLCVNTELIERSKSGEENGLLFQLHQCVKPNSFDIAQTQKEL